MTESIAGWRVVNPATRRCVVCGEEAKMRERVLTVHFWEITLQIKRKPIASDGPRRIVHTQRNDL